MSSSAVTREEVKFPHYHTAPKSWLERAREAGLHKLLEVNRELWLVFSLFLLAWILNFLVDSQRMVLGFYTIPTLISAYVFGRRHAVLTAFASIFLVGLVVYYNPTVPGHRHIDLPIEDKWFDLTIWGGILVITAYTMGTLYEHKQAHIQELRDTYNGILMILQHFISKDKYTQNHSYRVSVYATKLAACMGLSTDRIEDVRAAALLHDIGKLDVSREILYKAARLTQEEYDSMRKHVEIGVGLLSPVGGSLRRILPIILAHHDRYDGSGYYPNKGEEIPLEARILAVADVYDSMTSDRPYRKAMSPFDAKEVILKGSGTDFDPHVVAVFIAAFNDRKMEVPEVII
ncbi:MAG TPA: HD-GYP domain-containing protein [Terriglobales bacterium]|nr:HD-GYP domain-containing protein [Terriglobales bacterium]